MDKPSNDVRIQHCDSKVSGLSQGYETPTEAKMDMAIAKRASYLTRTPGGSPEKDAKK